MGIYNWHAENQRLPLLSSLWEARASSATARTAGRSMTTSSITDRALASADGARAWSRIDHEKYCTRQNPILRMGATSTIRIDQRAVPIHYWWECYGCGAESRFFLFQS